MLETCDVSPFFFIVTSFRVLLYCIALRADIDVKQKGFALVITDAERVKKPKLPKKRLLKKVLKSKGRR